MLVTLWDAGLECRSFYLKNAGEEIDQISHQHVKLAIYIGF